MRRHPIPRLQIAAQGRESGPFLKLRWGSTTCVAQERVKDFRIANAYDCWFVRIEVEKAYEPNRFGRRRFARSPMPFDLGEVRPDDCDLVRAGEIQQRWPGEEPGIQPQRAIGHKEIETGPAQKIATHSAASSAARGEHKRNNDRGSYKSWAMNGDGPNFVSTRSSQWGGPTSSFTGRPCHEMGLTVDVHMRRARRADVDVMWRATLQTVWDDIPEDERARLNRDGWEAHFRKKIEPYMAGDRTERWIAETADHELLGYLILGEGGFMTPEAQGFIYDIWVTPNQRGKGVGKFLVEWASDWARQRGYRKIKLEVSETNAPARHVYESLGFRAERRYMGKPLE